MPASSGSSKTKASRTTNLKPYIAIIYIIILVLFIHRNCEKYSSLKEFDSSLSAIPSRSMILTDFGLQYKTLYARPDLHLIPSCELGFPTKNIRKEYIEFINEGDVLPLARKTKARFFLENKKMYINPLEGKFLKLLKESNDLKVWRILIAEKYAH